MNSETKYHADLGTGSGFGYWKRNVVAEVEIKEMLVMVFRAQEPKAPVTYCDHALSGVRPSSVRRPSVRRPSSVKLFTFSTSSPEPLDGF